MYADFKIKNFLNFSKLIIIIEKANLVCVKKPLKR